MNFILKWVLFSNKKKILGILEVDDWKKEYVNKMK